MSRLTSQKYIYVISASDRAGIPGNLFPKARKWCLSEANKNGMYVFWVNEISG